MKLEIINYRIKKIKFKRKSQGKERIIYKSILLIIIRISIHK